uniref:Uncharacterized protein n=1 Tax=Arundo donax TaxID=35708 RepID=A0A0A8ZJ23_ARUDO
MSDLGRKPVTNKPTNSFWQTTEGIQCYNVCTLPQVTYSYC